MYFCEMKKLFPLIFILIILFSCHERHEYLHPLFMWDKTYTFEFDSVHLNLIYAVYNNEPYKEQLKLYQNLCSIANKDFNKEKNEIIFYWRYALMRDRQPQALIADSIRNFIQYIDSINRPYVYKMFLFLLADNESDVSFKYNKYNQLLKWFRERGDSLQTGRLLLRLAKLSNYNAYINTENKTDALFYYRLADNAFKKINAEIYVIKNLLNIASTTSDSTECDSLHTLLRNNTIIKSDTATYEVVLRNSFINSMDYSLIDQNIEILKNNPSFYNELAINYSIKSDQYYFQGDFRKATDFNKTALNLIDTFAPAYYYQKIFLALAYDYRALGKLDSAIIFQDEYTFWHDSIVRENDAIAFIGAEAAQKISESESRRKIHEVRTRWLAGSIILAVIIVALTIGFILYRNAKRKEIKALIVERELGKSKSSLAAHSLVLAEKDNMLREMENAVKQLQDDKKINDEDARSISNALKIHKSDNIEREDFLKIHENLYPDFSKRLKEDFPTLSEPQLRMASYIASGLTNAHIARLMNIETASVRTNRYRLRKKFNLPSDLSLEDFLRRYTSF